MRLAVHFPVELMNIIQYTNLDFENCVGLFVSNRDKYFGDGERSEYIEFLNTEALEGNYFVVKENSNTVAAGGFSSYQDVYSLDWGMVDRRKHGQGIGSRLTEFRINKIRQLSDKARIKLCTSQHTVGFYEKFGFRIVNITENGYGQDLHKYELELNGVEPQLSAFRNSSIP